MNSPLERSRKALEGVNLRKLLEESNLPVEIATAITDRLESQTDELLAKYDGVEGRRHWWSGGTWLHPGDEVVVRCRKT